MRVSRQLLILLILIFFSLIISPSLFSLDLSNLDRDWEKAEVRWTYNPLRLFLLDIVPEPAVSVDGEKFYGYVFRVGRNEDMFGRVSLSYANLLLPKELGKEIYPGFFQYFEDVNDNYSRLNEAYQVYRETEIGEKLDELTGDRGWYNWEGSGRHMGTQPASIWTSASSGILKVSGLALGGIGTAVYLSDSEEITQQDMYTMVGIGAGMVLTANIVDLFERLLRAREYRSIADRLNE